MSNRIIVGAQWGDEGKGKIVDFFAQSADTIIRFNGGSNAGHTLRVSGQKYVLHLIPSGILHPDKQCFLGSGMAIDPSALLDEIQILSSAGIQVTPDNLRVSARAHLVLPYHIAIDQLREKTSASLGTTGRGIGPSYEDRVARRGIRVGDLVRPEKLLARLEVALAEANDRIQRLGGSPIESTPLYEELLFQGQRLEPFVDETCSLIYEANRQGKILLFEGAQGILLDIDYGTYPYVTSSTTLPWGAFLGTSLAVSGGVEIVGVVKAYVTRVGKGPFPSELTDQRGDSLRQLGQEFGATTGRPRRCGWLDLPALRHAVKIGGLTQLAVTKLDILAGIHPLMICDAYRLKGKIISHYPMDADDLEEVEPVLREVESFSGELSTVHKYSDLPAGAKQYLSLLEKELGIPVTLVSVGPERAQTFSMLS